MSRVGNSFSTMSPDQAAKFKYWQRRTIIASMVGYALFYFVRKNLSLAMPALQTDLGITKAELGIFLTLHGLVYGVSKFVNGYWGDRANARHFMITGLLLSSLCNIIFGFSSAVAVFGVVWVFNGWFQGMGFPPCARLLTHWVHPKELATKMSIWNTSHSIGAGLVLIVCGYVVSLGWRWCFFVPSMIAILGAVYLWFAMRDTPSSVGLPEIMEDKDENSGKDVESKEFKQFVRKKVFGNPYIWIIAIANFFVYTVRFAILDWGPTILKEWKDIDLSKAGWMVAAFEIAGITGMLLAGKITDKYFGGRGSRVAMICMALATFCIFLFWQAADASALTLAIILMFAGFFIYGPQALVGIIAANLATKKAAATAAGFTGLFGYASGVVTGWGLGTLTDSYGWGYSLGVLIIAGVVGTIAFLCAWGAKADGYDDLE